MDPSYDRNASLSQQESTAYAWGQRQARTALSEWSNSSVTLNHVIFFDVEDDYPTGPAIGWDEEMGDCVNVSSTSTCCSVSVDRSTFDGFWDYIYNNSVHLPGVYSSPGEWTKILGTGSSSQLSNTMEWTADFGSNCVDPGPYEWTQGGGCPNNATFFAGKDSSSNCAVAWQWSGGNADYDQIDSNRLFICN